MVVERQEQDARTELLSALIERQGDRTNREFADILGIKEPTWQVTRGGWKRLDRTIAVAAARVYPELTELALRVLFDLADKPS